MGPLGSESSSFEQIRLINWVLNALILDMLALGLFDLLSKQSRVKNSSTSLWQVRNRDRGNLDCMAR